MKKLLCMALCFVFLFTLGCSEKSAEKTETATETAGEPQPLNLLYSKSDNFNPYTAATDFNRRICGLIFDSLIKTDNSFKVKYILAQSAELSGSTCTVTLREAAFTDGTNLTAEDVIYSFNLAKSNAAHAEKLYEVSSVLGSGNTVTFNLSRNDPYFLTLIDFPVLKSGTAGRTDSDGVEIPPVGCGRFILSEDKTELTPNGNYYGKKCTIPSIKLINAPDADSAAHYVEVGATDLYYTDRSESIVRMSGKRSEVNINRFVYIGVNCGLGQLALKEMRYAISSALDRTALVSDVFYDNAYAAGGYFNPVFEDAKSTATLKLKADTQITVENLSKLGYNKKNDDGYYINSIGKPLAFSLLVNEDNALRVAAAKLIESQCKAAGIKINVIGRGFEEYKALLAAGSFELYLGEIEVLPNMDLSRLVLKGGSAAFGVEESAEEQMTLSAAYDSFYKSEIGINDLSSLLLTQMPQIPLCYRKGLLFYGNKIKSGVESAPSDIYFSIEDYTF